MAFETYLKKKGKIFLFAGLVFAAILLALISAPANKSRATEGTCTDCNVVIILVDALRKDRLGCYGYPLPTSPNIDSLCSESAVFDNAFAQGTFTKLAIASLFTSEYFGPVEGKELFLRLKPETPTLAENFERGGFLTAGIISGNLFFSNGSGFERGFSEYVYLDNDDAVTENAVRIMGDFKNSSQPFFMYLHYMAPHAPFDPPEEHSIFRKGGEYSGNLVFTDTHQQYFNSRNLTEEDLLELSARYDGEVRYADASVGKILSALKLLGKYNKTVVIILADHGELLGEWRGRVGHGYENANVTSVPLIVRIPGKEAKRVASFAETGGIGTFLSGFSGLSISNQSIPSIFSEGRVFAFSSSAVTEGFPNFSVFSVRGRLYQENDGSYSFEFLNGTVEKGVGAAEFPEIAYSSQVFGNLQVFDSSRSPFASFNFSGEKYIS